MKHKQIASGARDASLHSHALIFDIGDEVISVLERFAADQNIGAAQFTAIGAFSEAVIAYFDWETKEYEKIPVREQVEVLVLAGDVALKDEQPSIHAHVVLGRRGGATIGGHLVEARVRPTLELILHESPLDLRKRVDDRTGLALIDPS